MLQAPPYSPQAANVTYVQENKRLQGASFPAHTCRQLEPQSVLPEAHFSCTTTKLVIHVAAQKHRDYNFRIHLTLNLPQHMHFQSMIISLHVSDIFL